MKEKYPLANIQFAYDFNGERVIPFVIEPIHGGLKIKDISNCKTILIKDMNQIKYAMVKYYSFDENNLGFVNMFGMMKKMEHSGVAIKGAIFSLLKIQIAFDGTNDKSKFHHLYNFIQTKKATYKELEPYINKIKKTLRNNYLEIYGERA